MRPNFEKPFTLYTDVSSATLGAILAQRNNEGGEGVIVYAIRGTRGAEKNYSAAELECLGPSIT